MTNQTETAVGGNLANASQFVKLSSIKGKIEAGKICHRIIAKTRKDESGKEMKDLPESLAIIVPDNLSIANCQSYPTLAALMLEAVRNVQRDLCKSFAVKGEAQVWHNEISPEKMESFAAEQNEKLGRLTLDQVSAFFTANAEHFLAAYSVFSGRDVTDANRKQVEATLEGLLKRLCESDPILASEKQEELLEAALESCEAPETARLQAKLQKAKKLRQDAVAAAADLGL